MNIVYDFHEDKNEIVAIMEFAISDREKMMFEYETIDKAKSRASCLSKVIKRKELNIFVTRSKNCIYFVKKGRD